MYVPHAQIIQCASMREVCYIYDIYEITGINHMMNSAVIQDNDAKTGSDDYAAQLH